MTTAQEIISFVKNRRGRLCDERRRTAGQAFAIPRGLCSHSKEVTSQFGGQVFWNDEASDAFSGEFSGHYLSVVPTRNPAGLIIDFTHPETIVLGEVTDVNNDELVRKTLDEITSHSGWIRRRASSLSSVPSPSF